jgi:two-component system phosphate regulon sensor histidine kinase PhoR
MTLREAVAGMGEPRGRSIVAVTAACLLAAALTIPLADWRHGTAFLTAASILLAVLAGAVGGMFAGLVVAAVGWTLNAAFVVDGWPEGLLALPAWLAAGAVAGWLATQIRRKALERHDELVGTYERLRESEAKYDALTLNLPVVTYVRAIDDDRRLIFVSPQVDRLIGYTAQEVLRDPDLLLRLVHAEDRDRVGAWLARESDPGRGDGSEYRIQARDGRIVWVQDEAVPVLDARGRPVLLHGYLLDVSARKAADEERRQLRAAEAAARAEVLDRQLKSDFLAQAAAHLASSLDYSGTVAQVARLAVRELADWCIVDRLEENGTVTRIAAERAEGDVGAEPAIDVLEVVKERRPRLTASQIVLPLVSHGGRTLGAITVVAGVRRRPFTSDDLSWAGALAGMAALSLDSARLHDEVEARAEAARVLSYVGDGVFLVDRAGVVRFWNPMAEAITQLAADSVIGRSAVDAIPGWKQIDERVPIAPAHEPAAAAALPLETDRGERWLSISGVEFFGGTVYAFRDITDEHRLEELQAEFVATASHELRTPLAAVYGAAQTLRRHDFALDEAGRERFISMIVDESERLGRIVNQILLANQLDVGRLELVTEAFDAPDLLERVAEAARTYIPPHITIDVVVGEHMSPVAADKDRVRQILVNLVDNAIKYSPDGGRIELGVDDFDGLALFHVADEGIGIPLEERPRIFEKFYRLDPDMTRGIGGTGLGLYICSELVERMGGRIWVESREEGGSAFFFELPETGSARAAAQTGEPSAAERIAK